MTLFVPPTPGAKFHFTPKQSARVYTIREEGSPLAGPRSWDRVPVTPVAPRRKSHKVWKRFLEKTWDATAQDDGLQNRERAVLESACFPTDRGTKRLKIAHEDQGGYAGRSFLETRWEASDMRIKGRKIPPATVERPASSPMSAETLYECTNDATPFSTDNPFSPGPAQLTAHGGGSSFDDHVDDDNNEDYYDPNSDDADDEENNSRGAVIDQLAPISSPAPVYISPETSLILAEEDEEETSMLESAPTTSTLPSSPPAAGDYVFGDIPNYGEEQNTDDQFAHLHQAPRSSRDGKLGLELRITPPFIQNSLLLEDDAEFLAEFVINARAKRDTKLQDLPFREATCLTETPDAPEAPDTLSLSPSNNSDRAPTPPDDQEDSVVSDNKHDQSLTHRHDDCDTSTRVQSSNRVDKKKTNGGQGIKFKRRGMGLNKQTRCSPRTKQSKGTNLPAAFDSIAITERVRRRKSTRKTGSAAKSKAGKQGQRHMPKLQVQIHAEDPVLARQIYLSTQANTKANKGDAKRAPTVLRRMRLEERKKKKESESGGESDEDEVYPKPRKTSSNSKQVWWDEERLVEYIDGDSSEEDESAQESDSDVDSDDANTSAVEESEDCSVDRDSSPDPIAEAEAEILFNIERKTTTSTLTSKGHDKQDQNDVSKRLAAARATSQTIKADVSKDSNDQQSRFSELPSQHESIDTSSLSPFSGFGMEKTTLGGGKTVNVSPETSVSPKGARCRSQ